MGILQVRQVNGLAIVCIAATVLLGLLLIREEHGKSALSQFGFRVFPSLNAITPTDTMELEEGGEPLWETTIPGGAHIEGFTIFDNLYLRNGTLYVISHSPESFLDREKILSAPISGDVVGADLRPNEKHLQIIHPEEAEDILGGNPLMIDEFTVIVYDSAQFMRHYYHWWGEVILGFWRVYAVLLQNKDLRMESVTSLEFPRRLMLPFVEEREWRDKAGIDGPLMRAANPLTSIETWGQWQDYIALDRTIAFKRVAIINRRSAHRHRLGSVWFKMIAGTMSLDVPDCYWEPLRRTVVKNLVGFVPRLDNQSGMVLAPQKSISERPVVVYVDRQKTNRRLVGKDHEALVRSLKVLEEEGVCEVYVAQMENLNLREQVELVSKATVIVGVHGNGLTHQLWMPPSPRSTVIEILIPEGYAFDYEMLARNMGHQHYAIWNDTYHTYPKGTTHLGVNYPDGFHSPNIPVYAPTVAAIIKERLLPPSKKRL